MQLNDEGYTGTEPTGPDGRVWYWHYTATSVLQNLPRCFSGLSGRAKSLYAEGKMEELERLMGFTQLVELYWEVRWEDPAFEEAVRLYREVGWHLVGDWPIVKDDAGLIRCSIAIARGRYPSTWVTPDFLWHPTEEAKALPTNIVYQLLDPALAAKDNAWLICFWLAIITDEERERRDWIFK